MSEASLSKVTGKIPLHLKCLLQQKSAGTLGIDRDKVKSFYKNPSKENVFHQVRRVTKLTIRLIMFTNHPMQRTSCSARNWRSGASNAGVAPIARTSAGAPEKRMKTRRL